ncbi:VacJ family lipoprotein [Candidatus Albibeggiatoa sp. nov. NOAA]|uniref:MlaA family lipoprotein n=1 Tax=Candidatus Albibeggiatoa sp. nov. NOAA TaxID=3162724 RepID=UPI003301AE30|nr:VacJ family lipoprotein [Thiotrichaceae bacterium]
MIPKAYRTALILFILPFFLSACGIAQKKDPFEKFNRAMYDLSNDLDMMVVRPAAEIYKAALPDPVDKGISNFFSNLGEITVIANDLLQLKFKQAAQDTGRFAVNTTVGLLGIFDVATHWGLEKHYEDFGQTLGAWGVGQGPYLYIPGVGPSTIRDATGRVVDFSTDARTYLADSRTSNVSRATELFDIIDMSYAAELLDIRADLIDMESILGTAAIDKYSYIREAYLKRREYLVYDGNPPQDEVDEEFLFEDDEDLEDEDFLEEELEEEATEI